MLDQIFGRLFLSQWIVFAVLLVLLVGLSELAWRMGLAGSRKKSEADKDSGTVRSAVLALLGLLLGFTFALAGARHETRRELLVEEGQTPSSRLRAGRSCYLSHTLQTWASCCASMFRFGSRRIVRGNFRINSQRRANAVPSFKTVCGLRRSPLPRNGHLRSPPVSSLA
jgi:hypothetical protein